MEIIHLILGKANPNRMNGVNKVVNSLATYQVKQGFSVSVWGITENMVANYPARNYNTVLFPRNRNKFTLCHVLKVSLERITKPTIFHIHGGFIPDFYHVAKKLVELKIEYVFTPHGAYNIQALKKNKLLKKVYFMLAEKYIAQNAKAMHCIGASEMDMFHAKEIPVNHVLIPNGQNIEELTYEYKQIKDVNHPIFGFCGRIDIKTKGLDLLFKAFAHYRHKRNKEGELWIIGDSNNLITLKLLARKLKIANDVHFFGKKFGEEKLNIMANMTTFFHPSRNEGLPGAVLEAAGLKVPCVVSKESNMASYINTHNAGIGLISNDIDNISKAMAEMAEKHANDSLPTLKENAIKMVSTVFNWNVIAQKMMDVYLSKKTS